MMLSEWLLWALCGLSLIGNMVLAAANERLRKENAELWAAYQSHYITKAFDRLVNRHVDVSPGER
jgi:hypothetical protein